MPATSIFIKAASSGTSGIGYSRISVLLGPTLSSANNPATTEKPPFDRCCGQSRTDPGPVKRDFSCRLRPPAASASDKTRARRSPRPRAMAMPGASKIPSKMLRSLHKRPEYLQALDRVKEWTRSRFRLPEDAAILVTEVACALPGCPSLETVVAFWTDADTRHHFKVFKRVEESCPMIFHPRG